MTKEQFINKWPYLNDTRDTINPYFISDLDAVIAHEVAKVQEAQPQPIELKGNCSTFDMSKLVDQEYKPTDQVTDQVTDQEKPKLNPIEQAYERGEKIRHKNWHITHWIKKYSDTEAIDEPKNIYDVTNWAFRTEPHEWELYTEPTEQPAQPSSQVKLDNSFDKDRFEAMFRAVYQSTTSNFDKCIEYTKENLTKLDAYYASKEGGANE